MTLASVTLKEHGQRSQSWLHYRDYQREWGETPHM